MTDNLTSSAALEDVSADTPVLLENTIPTRHNPDTPSSYNPDDYRWVPVRRRPRYDGWTEEKQRRFIEVLADTGIATAAAKAVGMSRESANRLRRSPHGAAFARAWDAARHHAGSVLEDIAFERAIEGVEHNVYDENGEVICTKRVYNDRLLTFLLGALKPERYGRNAASQVQAGPQTGMQAVMSEAPSDALAAELAVQPCAQLPAEMSAELPITLDASLRAMEPQLPAPPEDLLGAETLEDEMEIAEIADGKLPGFLSEQRPLKSAARQEAEAAAAQQERGQAALKKQNSGNGPLSTKEFKDMCVYFDPTQRNQRGKKRFR